MAAVVAELQADEFKVALVGVAKAISVYGCSKRSNRRPGTAD